MEINKYEKQHKKFLALSRRESEIYQTRRNLGQIELDKPIFNGWKVVMVPRKDIQNREDAKVFWDILSLCMYPGFIKSKSQLTRDRVNFYWHFPKLCQITQKTFDTLLPEVKRYFGEAMHQRNPHVKMYNCVVPNFYWEEKLVKRFITHFQVHDSVLEKELSEVQDELYDLGRKFWKNGIPKFYKRCKNRSFRRKNKVQTLKMANSPVELLDDLNWKVDPWIYY